MAKNKGRLVYSTRADADVQRKPAGGVQPTSLPPRQQTIRVMLDRKGRRGKTVTLCAGFQLSQADLKELEKQLKQRCGAGGTSTQDTIEIQGDQRDLVMEMLRGLGYQVKRAGG